MSYRSMPNVLLAVSLASGCSKERLCGKSKHQHLIHARRVFCVLARRRSRTSYSRIGSMIGRDHTTVRHHILSARIGKIDQEILERAESFLDHPGHMRRVADARRRIAEMVSHA